MTEKPCKYCGTPIDFEQDENGKWFTINPATKGRHVCAKKTGSQDSSKKGGQFNRFTGFKEIKEVGADEVNQHIVNGWVVLDRGERTTFKNINMGTELVPNIKTVGVSASVYVVGRR